ncbi:MAG: threonine synthase [Treponema sp.]|jgi:threonine synthase|nr:threonine synthase [Treponema sp.]
MRFVSTKTGGASVSFKTAVLRCLPEEGGLFVPESPPDLRQFILHMDEETGFSEMLSSLIPVLFEGELDPAAAARIAASAAGFKPELIRLGPVDSVRDETGGSGRGPGASGEKPGSAIDRISVLNLYNGPTGTFLDFAITFLAALLEELLSARFARTMVVSAVRGTGISVARAFLGRRGITAALLYPENFPTLGIDPKDCINRGGNLIPIQVEGTADDCQDLVAALINDRPFAERHNITSANAINPGRLLSQVFYFLYSFIQLKRSLSGELVFSLPTGNLGSLITGLYAWKFGMPVNGFIAAMNSNNAAGGFIRGQGFSRQSLVITNSPRLDITRPSNLERLETFYREAPVVMRNMVFPESIDDQMTLQTIKKVRERHGLFLDPQSAVAFAAAEKIAAGRDFYGDIVVFATEHPARYAETIYKATGERIAVPDRLKAMEQKTEPVARIKNSLESVESAIAGCF